MQGNKHRISLHCVVGESTEQADNVSTSSNGGPDPVVWGKQFSASEASALKLAALYQNFIGLSKEEKLHILWYLRGLRG